MKPENLKKTTSIEVKLEKDVKAKFFNLAKKNGLMPSRLVYTFIRSLLCADQSEIEEYFGRVKSR